MLSRISENQDLRNWHKGSGVSARQNRLGLNTVRLRIFVGWVEQSETQQMPVNVGFRSLTQPT